VNCTKQPSGLAVKRRASRCSVVSVLAAGAGAPATTQNRRQKFNGTVSGLTHDRRVDRVTMLPLTLSRRSLWFRTVSPVRFEIPARAASRSSKLIPIKGRCLPNQIAELTAVSGSVRRSGFGVSHAQSFNAQTTALRGTQSAPLVHGMRPGPVCGL
jgi:hypothetical protein